jgi:hypothetical protein
LYFRIVHASTIVKPDVITVVEEATGIIRVGLDQTAQDPAVPVVVVEGGNGGAIENCIAVRTINIMSGKEHVLVFSKVRSSLTGAPRWLTCAKRRDTIDEEVAIGDFNQRTIEKLHQCIVAIQV